MNVARLVSAAALATGLSACTANAPTTPLDVQAAVAVGQTAEIERAPMRLTFVAVTGDSRCPADALCIQGGDAVVHVEIQSTDASAAYDLHTATREAVRHASFTIALVELSPYPFSSRPFPYNEYVATFRITR